MIMTEDHELRAKEVPHLKQSAIFKIIFDDNVCHSIKHELDVVRIGGAC